MSEELAITPRNLGGINLAAYCPACFYFLLRLKFHAPFCHFGGAIFGDAQSCQEAIIGYHLEHDGCLPKEFTPYCDCVARVKYNGHWSKFKTTHESGVLLYGSPDEILERKDGSLCVIDHKTAHNKGDKDPFHGQYETQVVGYSYIAQGMGLGKVTKAGLLYWEAQVEAVEANPSSHYKRAALWLAFEPSAVEIKLDYKMLDPLIKELKAVWHAAEVPDGRVGCDDCKMRDLLFAIDAECKRRDEKTVRDYPDSPSMRREAQNRLLNQPGHRMRLLAEFGAVGGAIFLRDGVVANWEFLDVEDSVAAA